MKTPPAIVSAFFSQMGLPTPIAEHRFHAVRKWRFDYAWPELLIALEVEGGVWTGGRHTSGKGFIADMEKYNHAASSGWAVIRTTPKGLLTVATVQFIRAAMAMKES